MGKLHLKIDRTSSRSLTDQLADALRTAIVSGKLKDGDRLPTREELIAETGVGKNVAHAAVARLVAEGLVCSRPRVGCRVIRSNARPMRGHVLEVVTGSELPFWNVQFSETFKRTLYDAHISCSSMGLVYDSRNRFDPGSLEYELAHRPDLVLIKTSGSRVAGIRRYFDRKGIPYVLFFESVRGRHPLMLWENPPEDHSCLDEFVADCRKSGIRSVLWFCSTSKGKLDPRPALEAAGIAVESMASFADGKVKGLGLDQYVAQACARMSARIRRGPLCDLLFVTDDYLAMGAIPALLENGIRIPQDLKLVTYYNNGFGPHLTKSLARIEADYAAIAQILAKGVVSWFRTGAFPPMVLPPLKYIRGETFPVKNRH